MFSKTVETLLVLIVLPILFLFTVAVGSVVCIARSLNLQTDLFGRDLVFIEAIDDAIKASKIVRGLPAHFFWDFITTFFFVLIPPCVAVVNVLRWIVFRRKIQIYEDLDKVFGKPGKKSASV